MTLLNRASKKFAIIVFVIAATECRSQEEITVQDFLNAKSIEDITKKNPNLKNDPPELFSGHKEIIQAVLAEDLKKLSSFFDKNVDIEIGDAYYEIFRMTKSAHASFYKKESLLYKFIFDHEAAMKELPTITRVGTKWHSIKYCIVNGSYAVSTRAIIGFDLKKPKLHGVTIRTDCTQEKCVITGFSIGSYGAGLDK